MKEDKEKIPFSKQAAKASWVLPLITLAIMAFSSSILKNASSPFTSLLIGGIIILFFLSGIIFSIAGIFGIKKHGSKRILIPSIIGFILNFGFLFLLLFIAFMAFQKYQNG